jgi:4-oxalocrotonate tautomerase
MPFVTVQIYPGRTVDQKRKLAKAITDAMVEHVDAKPGNLNIIIQDVAPDSWALGGILGIDREKS